MAKREANPGARGGSSGTGIRCLEHPNSGPSLPTPPPRGGHQAKQGQLAVPDEHTSLSPECGVFIPARPREGLFRSCSRPSMKVKSVISPGPRRGLRLVSAPAPLIQVAEYWVSSLARHAIRRELAWAADGGDSPVSSRLDPRRVCVCVRACVFARARVLLYLGLTLCLCLSLCLCCSGFLSLARAHGGGSLCNQCQNVT